MTASAKILQHGAVMPAGRTVMPAEWEPHAATWIAWPHEESDWPGKFETIPWVYAEIVRGLTRSERVEILCHEKIVQEQAISCLKQQDVPSERYRLHVVKNDRSWLRDSGPIAVKDRNTKAVSWVGWRFNGWAKYPNFLADEHVAASISAFSEKPLEVALRPDNGERMVLEGGSIDVDGEGTLLTTEECLLSKTQERNPGMDAADYERAFQQVFGISQVIWLDRGIVGDDTHGHVDDIARFVSPGRVVVAFEEDAGDPNHEILKENYLRLKAAKDARGRALDVVKLPMPEPVLYEGERLPASYCNFYIANGSVLVPTFNAPQDRIALNILSELFPKREVIGIHAVDLVLGLGTLHCLTQQQPS